MISVNDFRTGLTILMDGEIYTVVEFMHVKPGKGAAFVRSRLKNVETGAVKDHVFRAGEKVEQAHVDTKQMQYLYSTGDEYYFMDTDTYEQVMIPLDIVGEARQYLIDNMTIGIQFHKGRPIGFELPTAVELEVVDTEPGFKGDTATGGSKPATVETGLVVQVPLFVEKGEKIKVDTRSGEYLSRA